MTANQPEPGPSPAAPTTTRRRRPADTFANRLLLTRALAGHLSIREAAQVTGLNREAWRDWERGRKPRDILDACRRIADALDVDHDWLLFGGPLAGPRGVPVDPSRISPDQAGPLPRGYGELAERPRSPRPATDRPNTRPPAGQRPGAPPRPEQRRPVRISRRDAA